MRFITPLRRRVLPFLRRHKWSLPLTLLSAMFFGELASEVRENELAPFDSAVATFVGQWRGSLDVPMRALTDFGSGIPMACFTSVVVAALWFKQHRREARFLVFSALGAFLLNGLLKSLFHRPRPGATLLYLIDTPASFSFPSGHAMGAMGVLGGMVVVVHALRWPQALRIVVTSTAVCVIVGIALSRVYFGVHFPSDVIGGQLAGAAWISALTGYFYPRLLPGERTQVTAESGGPL